MKKKKVLILGGGAVGAIVAKSQFWIKMKQLTTREVIHSYLLGF